MSYYDDLTEFIFVEDEPQKADYIFIPGSGYGELAQKAARLYHGGYARKIVVSGKHSVLEKTFAGPVSPEAYVGKRYETECDFLAEVLEDCGVDPSDIQKERRAGYTFANAIYTRSLLKDRKVESAILVCQAYHARRCLMYYGAVFPQTCFFVCPAVTRGISRDSWYRKPDQIETVLGEVERLGRQFHEIMQADAQGKLTDCLQKYGGESD